MKLTIIIPTKNRRENIIKTITCLGRQVVQPHHTVQIIVVDDNSTDQTSEAIGAFLDTTDHFPFSLLMHKNKQRDSWSASIPRNIGAKLADEDTDCFYFLDSDILLAPNRIQRLIDDFLLNPDPNRVIIGPYHYASDNLRVISENWYEGPITNYQQDVRWKSFRDHPVQETNTGVGFALACFGGSIMIPRELFFAVDMYDEKCVAGVEDGDMGLMLLKFGAIFSLDKELLGWHNPHPILPSRTENIEEMKKYINMKHFGTENPDYGILEATRETYGSWGFDWHDPKWEDKK